MNALLDSVLAFVVSVDPVLRTLLAGFGMFLETTLLVGLIIPGDTIVIVASTAVSNPTQYWSLLLSVIAGSLTGESVGFALGRFFGHRIRDSSVGNRIGRRNWLRAERFLARRGGIAVFVSRFLPVLHALIPVTVGMSAMPYRRFMAWTTPACIIWAVAYVSVGAAAAQGYRALAGELKYAGFLFAAAIALFLLIVLAVRHFLSRAQERHMAEDDDSSARKSPSTPPKP